MYLRYRMCVFVGNAKWYNSRPVYILTVLFVVLIKVGFCANMFNTLADVYEYQVLYMNTQDELKRF